MNGGYSHLKINDEKVPADLGGAGPPQPQGCDRQWMNDEAITEFQVPWLNARGEIQMIRAYLC